MTTKRLPLIWSMLLLTCAVTFGIVRSTDAQEVHALLIILGNDLNTQTLVEKNESNMKQLLRQVSLDCKVHLTVMKSEDETTGTVTTMTLSKAETSTIEEQKQEIISGEQVIQWVKELHTDSNDTLFIYYSGEGHLVAEDSHTLVFEPGAADNIVVRADLTTLLKEKPGRLKMLVTDTCSSGVHPIKPEVHNYAPEPMKNRLYIKHLFLQHGGILDITAASPGQEAWGSDILGGFFTASLIDSLNAESDTNKDGFLSWPEAFEASREQTQKLFMEVMSINEYTKRLMDRIGQKTQEPTAYSLPQKMEKL